MRINALLAILISVGVAACGGGGGNNNPSADPAAQTPASEAAVAETAAAAPATSTPPATAPATAPATSPPTPTTTPPVAVVPVAPPTSVTPVPPALAAATAYNFYRLGAANNVASATLEGDTLSINGQRYAGVNLTPGSCSVSSGNLTQCRSTASLNAFALCGVDQATNKTSSLFVLFDPAAVQITDARVLRNISFSGHEDCGNGNIGAQPKSAPSAKLSFDKDGNLSLTRYDNDPPKTSTLPSYFVNLTSDTTSNGVTARFNLYHLNGRYLLIATGIPATGITPTNPGTLIAFYQD